MVIVMPSSDTKTIKMIDCLNCPVNVKDQNEFIQIIENKLIIK